VILGGGQGVTRKALKNKPLAEAIFELRWDLQETAPQIKIDPHYKLLVGTLYNELQNEYEHHEQLITASMPDEITGYMPQHRFRKGKSKWPLIQIGPGVITVNDTEGYIWEDFEKRIIRAVYALFKVYPDSEKNLKINQLQLRYINAIEFDFEKDNIFTFLREHMKTGVTLHQALFEDTGVEDLPLNFDLKFSFPSAKPKGTVNIRFGHGKKNNADAMLWETMVQSKEDDAAKMKDKIADWIDGAHKLTDDWFFKLIKGELLERFQ